MTTSGIDHEDLWDAHQCVLDWRDSDNCDDTPAHRRRLLNLANRLKRAANKAAAQGIQPGGYCTVNRHTNGKPVRVMAVAEGYAMVRYPGYQPFIEPINGLNKPTSRVGSCSRPYTQLCELRPLDGSR